MKTKVTRVCFGCKESFRKEELVECFSSTGKTSHLYCPACLAEKQSREKFATQICEIFGVKSPGPLIWSQRKRLKDTYGYTDDSIIDCLTYLYTEAHYKKLKESLGLVAPWSMEKTKQWKASLRAQGSSIAAAIAAMKTKEYVVPVQESTKKKETISLDDGLFDDD